MRVAIVGLGNQGKKRLFCAGEDAVGTVDPFNDAAQYRDIEELSLDSYDAALVCTPDAQKFDLLEYLASNGKHVLVEKPLFAAEWGDLSKLQEVAAQNRAVCYTAYNHRFEPHIVRLKELLDSGVLGKVYWAKFFYGNGTARDVRESVWRDQGTGVLHDLGSHLLDLYLFLFGRGQRSFEMLSAHCFENKSLDHVQFASPGRPHVEMEATLLSWRNAFRADIWAELGSAHIDCLCKWGPSAFTVRKRVLPSGKPTEESQVLECADPTWALEYEHFKKLCREPVVDLRNDMWISDVLQTLTGELAEAKVR